MIEAHQDNITLQHTFRAVHDWLQSKGVVELYTAAGTKFVAKSSTTVHGKHSGELTLRFYQNGREFARAYECCWGHYYNCNRTRMGMYCQALDREIV